MSDKHGSTHSWGGTNQVQDWILRKRTRPNWSIDQSIEAPTKLAQHKISATIIRPLRRRGSSGDRRGSSSSNSNKGDLVSLRDRPPRWGRFTRATLPLPYPGGGTL